MVQLDLNNEVLVWGAKLLMSHQPPAALPDEGGDKKVGHRTSDSGL